MERNHYRGYAAHTLLDRAFDDGLVRVRQLRQLRRRVRVNRAQIEREIARRAARKQHARNR